MIMPQLSWRSWATIVSVVLLVGVVRIEEGRVARAHRRVGDYALMFQFINYAFADKEKGGL